MPTQPHARVSVEQYLELERAAEAKHEYADGEMFAMAGASPEHVLITGNLVRSLGNQLATRDCAVYASDLRVKVSATGLYTYPDVVVVCGTPRFEDGDTLLNPRLIIEVLSPSTEAYDRGRKFEQYRMIDSLTEYVLVAQDAAHIEVFNRQPDGRWLLADLRGLASNATLESVAGSLALADVYAKVGGLSAHPRSEV